MIYTCRDTNLIFSFGQCYLTSFFSLQIIFTNLAFGNHCEMMRKKVNEKVKIRDSNKILQHNLMLAKISSNQQKNSRKFADFLTMF